VAEHDLRSHLRAGASDEEIATWLKSLVWQKEARHHIGEPDFSAAAAVHELYWWIVRAALTLLDPNALAL
jgi:molybdenum cofactor biosynthesis enzyme MoaA